MPFRRASAKTSRIRSGGNKFVKENFGGIELSNHNDYEGGRSILNGLDSKSKRGHLFVHSPDEVHEITEVTKGTRYSLHFCISKNPNKLI